MDLTRDIKELHHNSSELQEKRHGKAKSRLRIRIQSCHELDAIGLKSMPLEKTKLPFDQHVTNVRLSRPIILTILLAFASAFLPILTLLPAVAGAYTVEKHDDAVTGQFVISPTKVELEMQPGESASRDIMVANRTGTTLTIEFSMEDFEGSGDPSQATIFKGDEDGTRGARRWLEPEISSIVIKHGETVTFRTEVNVPKNAEPGGHYAALFAASTYEAQNEQGSTVNITSRVGTLFLIRVAGVIHEEGTLEKPEVPSFSEYGPVDIGLVFNNQGNVHLKPSGDVTITNILGQAVADIPVPEWVVLPESSRRNIVKWDSHYLFGRYTATAEIGYTPDGTPIIVSSSFWVIPWKIVLAIALGVMLVITFVSWLVRRGRGARRGLEEPPATQEAGSPPEAAEALIEGAQTSEAAQQRLMPLDELFPSMGDTRIINLDDDETQKLIRDLIGQELDLARAYISDGRIEEARSGLIEARSAAQRISLLAEIGMIDDMLQKL
jgi:hypothetical protein